MLIAFFDQYTKHRNRCYFKTIYSWSICLFEDNKNANMGSVYPSALRNKNAKLCLEILCVYIRLCGYNVYVYIKTLTQVHKKYTFANTKGTKEVCTNMYYSFSFSS